MAGSKFNESSLVDNHRRVLIKVNTLLQNLEQKVRKLSVVNAEDYENDVRRDLVLYENISSVLSKISGNDQNNQNLKNIIEPPHVFLPSPEDVLLDPQQGTPPAYFSSPQDIPLVPHQETSPAYLPSPQDVPPPPENLPSPQYIPIVPHQDLPHVYSSSRAPPSVIPPDPIGLVKKPDVTTELHYPGHQLIPFNSIYPGLMMPPSIFCENCSSHYVANYSYPSSNFRPGEQGLYKEPPFIGHLHIIPLRPIYAPPRPPSFYVSEYTPLHVSTLTTTMRTRSVGANAKIWFNEIAPYTRAKKKKKKTLEVKTTTPINPRMTEPRNYWSITGTDKTAQLFNKDDYGFLHVALAKFQVRPGTKQEDPQKNWMTTATGDVLYGKIQVQKPSSKQPSNQRYQELMKQLDEGYLMVFVIELFRLIAVKNKREVQEVLAPLWTIYDSLSVSGRLAWVGEPLLIFIEKLSTVASSGGDSIDIIRTYSSMMFHSLLKRKEVLSSEVNSIIDQAELFYSDEEGRSLLRSLNPLEDYPNTTKTSNWICESLIGNILHPFQRPPASRSRERLLDSVNRALRRRFPLLMRERIRPKFGTNPSKIKRKHHHKKKRKIYLKPKYYNN